MKYRIGKIEKVNKARSWYIEKISKIDKPSTRLTQYQTTKIYCKKMKLLTNIPYKYRCQHPQQKSSPNLATYIRKKKKKDYTP